MRRENVARVTPGLSSTSKRGDTASNEKSHENGLRSRDNSPKMPRPRSEEIPLEDMRLRKASLTSNGLTISHICEEKKDGQISACSNNGEPSSVIRKHSEETGMKVWLCRNHHTLGPLAVHRCSDTMNLMHKIGQRTFEETHSRQQFVTVFGKSYL